MAAAFALATAAWADTVQLTCPPDIWVRPQAPKGYEVVRGIMSMEFKEARLFFENHEAERTRNGYLLYDEMTNLELRCYYAGGAVIGKPLPAPVRECRRITWGLECE